LLGTFGVAFDKVFRKNVTHGEASKTKYMLYFSIRGWGSHQSFFIRIEMEGTEFGGFYAHVRIFIGKLLPFPAKLKSRVSSRSLRSRFAAAERPIKT
jgi:hypothetical protein